MIEKVVEVTQLYKKYKESEDFALKDLSFSIQKGEVFGVLGTNGAGKTTLMSILMGGLQPTAGHFTICGLSYKGQAQQIRYKIGVVPQEYALYPTLTAKENLHYFASLYGLRGREVHDTITQALKRVGLWEVAGYEAAYQPFSRDSPYP